MRKAQRPGLETGVVHRIEEISRRGRPGGGPRTSAASGLQRGQQFLPRGNIDTLLDNHSSDGMPIPQAIESADQESQANTAPGLFPHAELSAADVFLHVLTGTAEEGELPIMDGAGPVGGDVLQPALLDHPAEKRSQPVPDHVGAMA